MSLNRVDDLADVARRRERFLKMAEDQVEDAVAAAMRQFLRRILDATKPTALTAAAPPPKPVDLFTLGQLNAWWQDAVDDQVVDAVARVWRTGYFATRDGTLEASSLEGAQTFMAQVRDRLSRTATPTIPDQAFDTARVALSDEMARGSSIRAMSERLGAEFGWSDDVTFWRDRLSDVDGRIDQILDPLGPPGTPAREAARLQDPTVQALRDQRNEAIARIDADRTQWQVRSERIARTETTGAYNAGAYEAGVDEGAGVKMWVATNDDRTRDEHMEANGQCVPVTSDFQVGGEPLAFPGDPSGPPELVINCRCTTVYADTCGELGAMQDQAEEIARERAHEQALAEEERREAERADPNR